MLTLVTGANGFVGQHLVRELKNNGHDITALDNHFPGNIEGVKETVTCDLRDAVAVKSAIASIKPDACIHLAAISFVPAGETDPGLMLTVNIQGTMNLLDAFKEHSTNTKILSVSTAHVYGQGEMTKEITEDAPMAPISLYAVTKVAADLATLAYANKYDLHAMTARPNNHTGPGQAPSFVVSSFAQQLKALATSGTEGTIKVGNMESTRAFTDVRDVVRAYRLIIEKGQKGNAYNITSDKILSIQSVFDKLRDLSGATASVEIDPDKFRPTDCSPLLNTSKLQKDTGWKAEIDFEQTLSDILAEI